MSKSERSKAARKAAKARWARSRHRRPAAIEAVLGWPRGRVMKLRQSVQRQLRDCRKAVRILDLILR